MKAYWAMVFCLLTGCQAQQGSVTHQYPDMDSPAFNTFAKACSQCHAPPQPSKHDAKAWLQVVTRMMQHRLQRGLPPLQGETQQTILQYLQNHAKKLPS